MFDGYNMLNMVQSHENHHFFWVKSPMDLPVFSLTPSAKGSDTDDSEAERIKGGSEERDLRRLSVETGIKAVTIQERILYMYLYDFICLYNCYMYHTH